MTHKGTQTLGTDRLILRRFTLADAGAMYDNWASEDAVTEYLTWPAHGDVDVTRAVLSYWIKGYESPDFYQWAIELKALGQVVGSVSVVTQKPAAESCELGWCLGTRWWGQGIMPEAGRAVLGFLFDQVGFARVAAAHAVGNPKSGRVMEKLGMRYEGTLRQAGRCNRGVVDEVWYAILKDEFHAGAGPFRPMRRVRQELSRAEAEAILQSGTTGVLAVHGDEGYPYAVPVNYMYKDGKIYFHGAKAGHKFDAMARCPRVSFCVIARDEVVPDQFADYYRSAVAFGHVRLLAGDEALRAVYDLGYKYNPDPAKVQAEVAKDGANAACFEITVDHLTGKQAKGLL